MSGQAAALGAGEGRPVTEDENEDDSGDDSVIEDENEDDSGDDWEFSWESTPGVFTSAELKTARKYSQVYLCGIRTLTLGMLRRKNLPFVPEEVSSLPHPGSTGFVPFVKLMCKLEDAFPLDA
jgi:hypothetical protein